MNNNQIFYLDNNATTRPYECVIKKMNHINKLFWGNISSPHSIGKRAKKQWDKCITFLKDTMKVENTPIITSGATEAANIGIRGVVKAVSGYKDTILCSATEHSCVMQTCRSLEAEGFHIKWIGVDENGRTQLRDEDFSSDVIMACVMYANNETGVINDVERISSMCHDHGALFCCDVTQAMCKVDIDFSLFDISFFSAHKFGGPKGVGVLNVKDTSISHFEPLSVGGAQQNRLRAGTESLALLAGMCEAIKQNQWIHTSITNYYVYKNTLTRLHLENIARVCKSLHISMKCNTDTSSSIPGVLSITFKGIDAELLTTCLDARGVIVSTGSACHSGNIMPSYVLTNMGLSESDARSTIRIAFAMNNYYEDYLTTLSDILYDALEECQEIMQTDEYAKFRIEKYSI